MDTKETLKQFGLTEHKTAVYLAALELGGASVIEIAKKSGLKRTTVYDILLDLERDGLISQTIKGKKRLFIGEDPEKIQKDLKQKENIFSEILPQLKSIYNTGGNTPKIRFYEGKEGLREVYSDTLKYSGEIVGFASEDVVRILGHDWAWDYMKRRKQKNLSARFILPETEFMKKEVASYDQEQLRTSKLVDAKKYPFSVEINIYGFSKVALMSSKEETGVIIESTEIYHTLRSVFELLWDNLPEVKK